MMSCPYACPHHDTTHHDNDSNIHIPIHNVRTYTLNTFLPLFGHYYPHILKEIPFSNNLLQMLQKWNKCLVFLLIISQDQTSSKTIVSTSELPITWVFFLLTIQTHTHTKWTSIALTNPHFIIRTAFETLTLKASHHILDSIPTFYYSTHTSFVETHVQQISNVSTKKYRYTNETFFLHFHFLKKTKH